MRVAVLGVNGVAGSAIAAEFADAGWGVIGTGRRTSRFPPGLRARGVEFVLSDRHDPAELSAVLQRGTDVVVDCLCYTAEHARQLLRRRDRFGSAIVLSSKAVYRDERGRHSNSDDPPRFDGLVGEGQSVLEPDYSGAFDSRDGYGANKIAAEHTLLGADEPISILRPSRIHGPGAARPREWFVVKRLLDGRTSIPLAQDGRTGNHPTASANLARLVRTCAENPGRRVLNAADPDHPTARDIVEAIAAACGRPIEIVGLSERAAPGYGWTPWSTWPPFFLDTSAALALGYTPVGTYAETVTAEVAELWSLPPEQQDHLTCDRYFRDRFDYDLDEIALKPEFR
ncbi:MAG TPA: NAD-dependent epimerase/dehydratase family protein [Pseudonocardia sp.]|nr:NAD-dependent epimerase/dehydratase family protein [Pseudonocardia sp.]